MELSGHHAGAPAERLGPLAGTARERAREKRYDAVVVGAGPNGLAAAITLARAGLRVLVAEARETPGGGLRSAALTLPGFVHDVCSAIHPLALLSPFFRSLQTKIAFEQPAAALAHPLDEGPAALLERGVEATAATLGADGGAWRRLHAPFVARAEALYPDLLGPLGWPSNPLLLARFGLTGLRSLSSVARGRFKGPAARALLAGCAAHSFLPLDFAGTAAFGLALTISGHAVGWPCARGGSQAIADALCAELRQLGGELVSGAEVRSLQDLPEHEVVLFDTAPRALARICGDALPRAYSTRLLEYRHGPGVFKIDYALSAPIPWRDRQIARAGTVHLGGTLEELQASEHAAWNGQLHERPFVLLAQQSLFDGTRAPAGKHTAWAYCHVPRDCGADRTEAIERQIERFAPGFKEIVLARSQRGPALLELDNANYIGGDIAGGSNQLSQLFSRPLSAVSPYRTPNPRLFLCSSSTPPGGGVHGQCGAHAARVALRRVFGR